MKIAMIGAGSWGTALASLLGEKGFQVRLWARRGDLARAIEIDRENTQYLPGIKLPDSVTATSDISLALADAEAVVIAIPSVGVREVLELIKTKLPSDSLLVHAGKGLESGTGLRGSEVIAQTLGDSAGRGCVALSGPNLAVELANGVPTATVVASATIENAIRTQELFSSPGLRVYRNSDIAGVELGGALKNVFAIGAGISDGLGYGDNTKATLVTRGLVEMTRLGVAMGADEKTFIGLSGFGDLMATCASPLSRNLRLGRMLGQGMGIEESLRSLGQVAEGMPTCAAAFLLSRKLDISMPITEQIYSVLFEGKSPRRTVLDLMTRDFRDELR
ncbi:MAG: NAD(P)-dependent glycerol-3-phosphate dehydrogenase [Armatimonadetes bacterium]|jgi:glycerol-3-phosphate dehydrogenase (NAD(P)+)|nr:NAD(P)-dependent glycerol-3-phosphate dehydrogenase [Armatimonadota bacterium]